MHLERGPKFLSKTLFETLNFYTFEEVLMK